ncbi:hypothetical protein [Amycolatopsis pigmentata]|uniref:Uncharacterized protein n=1 Tax=Amycolatopsis pigmentata TaxID=450801 RepID=A0ABW5FWC7_9PSEU
MPNSGPGGYEFDPATIAHRITDWEQVLDDIRNDENQLRQAQRHANPPSADKPAVKNAQDMRASIQAAIDQNTAMQRYIRQWIDALHKAERTYVAHDQELIDGGSAADGQGLCSTDVVETTDNGWRK